MVTTYVHAVGSVTSAVIFVAPGTRMMLWVAARFSSQVAQPPSFVGYSPAGQLERHWPLAARSGKTRSGQPPLVAHLFHSQLVHSVAAGPEHAAHVGSHAWHARPSSA